MHFFGFFKNYFCFLMKRIIYYTLSFYVFSIKSKIFKFFNFPWARTVSWRREACIYKTIGHHFITQVHRKRNGVIVCMYKGQNLYANVRSTFEDFISHRPELSQVRKRPTFSAQGVWRLYAGARKARHVVVLNLKYHPSAHKVSRYFGASLGIVQPQQRVFSIRSIQARRAARDRVQQLLKVYSLVWPIMFCTNIFPASSTPNSYALNQGRANFFTLQV